MKILMIHPHDIYSEKEPWTSRIRNIAKEFVAMGHEVRVVYFVYPGTSKNIQKKDAFSSFPLSRLGRFFLLNVLAIIRHGFWADIIHFQKCFAYASIPALFAHVFCNKPIHYDWDDNELAIFNASCDEKRSAKLIAHIEKTLPGFVDTLSVASEGLRDLALKLNFTEERIVKAHVCADLELFKPNILCEDLKQKFEIDKPVVMYMGQLHGGQYASLFIDSAKEVLKEKDVIFMIVGTGDRKPLLIQRVIENKISDRFIFTGAVKHKEVAKYLSLADVAVACFEDNAVTRCKSPLKIVEYMASGKAIVASDVGDVKWMLNGCGLLSKPGDVASLKNGILQLLMDEKSRKEFGKKARLNAEKNFGWKQTAIELMRAYETVVASN